MGQVKRFPVKIPRQPLAELQHEPMGKKKLRWSYPKRTFLLTAVVLVFGYVLFFSVSQQLQLRQLQAEAIALEAKRNVLLEEKLQWEEKLQLLERDETIEKIAREQLGMIKPGEKLLVIVQ